ncbi:MAG: HDIG domain-containing protein [Deltaproteobacteria bacterium]|jgi:putative nucleotidyltransferase with HDIG domain|nr:HDIG domain-containing protein [Deltaproteobacteria bacterium]
MIDKKNPKLANGHPHGQRPKGRKLWSGARFSYRPSRELTIRLTVIFFVSLITVILTNPQPQVYQAGKVASHTVRSDRDFFVNDPEATAQARLTAYNSAVPLFVFDDRPGTMALEYLRHAFAQGQQLWENGHNSPPWELSQIFCQVFVTNDCQRLLNLTWQDGFGPELERQVGWLTSELMAQGILPDDDSYAAFDNNYVEIGRLGLGRSMRAFESLLTLPRARLLAEARARLRTFGPDPTNAALVSQLTVGLIRPNLILDIGILKKRQLGAAAAVPEVIHHVRSGEIIVREGNTVSREAELTMAALSAEMSGSLWARRSIGLLVLLFIFMTVTQTLNRLDLEGSMGHKQLIILSALLLLFILLPWWSGQLGRSLSSSFDYFEPHTTFMAMPVPTAAMLGAIFLGLKRTIFLCFLGSFLGAIVAPMDTLTAFIYICNGCLVSNWHLRRISERSRLIPAAAMTALVNCLTLIGLTMMDGELLSKQFLHDTYAAILSGLVSGILASGLIPLIESLMGLTTNLKLMELGNLNRQLLRDLMLSAPGTYHHSVIVGSMVEAAAEAIGANPHLARVGAYYHDIGKIKKPLYFIENQMGENRHEYLTPTMSALVLVGHVKEGIELAREHKLPRQVIDIVEQHHGTSLMSYFFFKAKENRSPNSAEVNEGDFRYPGPKPAAKEAGLVMLADICEAATRTLTEPTPTKIQELVRTLVNRVFDDGQLDCSELVLKDVTETIRVFTNILIGIYHHRIAYPGVSNEAQKNQTARSKVIYGHFNSEQPKRLTH